MARVSAQVLPRLEVWVALVGMAWQTAWMVARLGPMTVMGAFAVACQEEVFENPGETKGFFAG